MNQSLHQCSLNWHFLCWLNCICDHIHRRGRVTISVHDAGKQVTATEPNEPTHRKWASYTLIPKHFKEFPISLGVLLPSELPKHNKRSILIKIKQDFTCFYYTWLLLKAKFIQNVSYRLKKKPLASKAIYVDTYTKTHTFIIFYNIIIIHIYIYAI